jgi:hypothetical protein
MKRGMHKLGWSVIMMLLVVTLSACGGSGSGDGGGTTYTCSWEERHTGCDGYGYGEWHSECYHFDSEDYYITPQEVCDNHTPDTSDPVCTQSGSCCIYTQTRNASLVHGGSCP